MHGPMDVVYKFVDVIRAQAKKAFDWIEKGNIAQMIVKMV